jgi:hypothetical protein
MHLGLDRGFIFGATRASGGFLILEFPTVSLAMGGRVI